MTERIEITPDVMMGKPFIRGTRVPIELIVRKIREGAADVDLLDAHPRLAIEDIRAALAHTDKTTTHGSAFSQGIPQL